MKSEKVALITLVFSTMIIQRFLHLIASFFLFAAFILTLLVIIGQVSNKPFLNILYFVQANNGQYNLSYNFGLWYVHTEKTNKQTNSHLLTHWIGHIVKVNIMPQFNNVVNQLQPTIGPRHRDSL